MDNKSIVIREDEVIDKESNRCGDKVENVGRGKMSPGS